VEEADAVEGGEGRDVARFIRDQHAEIRRLFAEVEAAGMSAERCSTAW
jgi:hypothetical protein